MNTPHWEANADDQNLGIAVTLTNKRGWGALYLGVCGLLALELARKISQLFDPLTISDVLRNVDELQAKVACNGFQ